MIWVSLSTRPFQRESFETVELSHFLEFYLSLYICNWGKCGFINGAYLFAASRPLKLAPIKKRWSLQ